MDENLVAKYLLQLNKLNRGYTKGLGKAPHKPILLLSIIELIKKQEITNSRIFITPKLVLTFRDLWKKLVDTGHIENFALPFFHLRSEPFWYLVAKPEGKISMTKSKSIKSFKNLKDNVAFAEIDKALFQILLDPIGNNVIKNALLDKYFSGSYDYLSEYNNAEESQIEYEIQNAKSKEYRDQLLSLKANLREEQFEEEIFIRSGLFKSTIPKIYDNTCCISGLKIYSDHNIQMVDACHIHPFSLSHDDTIPNGIALSPNMHRAFDRGLVTITGDYIVRVSPSINEEKSTITLNQFEGKQISLPDKVSWYPSIESLTWHNKEVFLL